ncbi:hypothetical protein DL96DRAFT_1622249 [Flagelloscypha sp. PMI_526]|nr:hypothetical protein DL96DRAFT_1622249 [Flagelloscypha sp. PMI_526]
MSSPSTLDETSRRDEDDDRPMLLHSLHEAKSSVLSLAASEDHIFSGNQNHVISVWCKNSYKLSITLRGHTGSVLDLQYVKEKDWLLSCGGDSTVRIWSTTRLIPLFVVIPYGDTQAGDLFTVAWSPCLHTIYVGCQDTSLQWLRLTPDDISSALNESAVHSRTESLERVTPISDASSNPGLQPYHVHQPQTRRAHKFFDSYPQYQRRPADLSARNGPRSSLDDLSKTLPEDTAVLDPKAFFCIPSQNVFDSAHFGYVYCMTSFEGGESGVESAKGPHLVTGSGDEKVKVWRLSEECPKLVHEFDCGHGAIYGFVSQVDEGTIYAASQDGYVFVLDLETRSIVRRLLVNEGTAILSISQVSKQLYTCSANGFIHKWTPKFDCAASWKGHDGIALSSLITSSKDAHGRPVLLTGGSDNSINAWDLIEQVSGPVYAESTPSDIDNLVFTLSKFISFPSVSSDPRHRDHCQDAAFWLKKCLTQLGAKSSLLSTEGGRNPLVLGTFTGTQPTNSPSAKTRILFYGHYDVVSAHVKQWESGPYTLSGRNGYLYGRGVTDNKGPIMAIASAASSLLRERKLGVDVVFLIEGEEESGSGGFEEAVKRCKEEIGAVDAILVSNSTWLAEDTPCITYGLRGVVRCSVTVKSGLPDLHSGVDGGAVREPMLDMVKLLGSLTDTKGKAKIPGFYDLVRPQTENETELFKKIATYAQKPPEDFVARWREPSLSMHAVHVPGSGSSTVIPGSVSAQLSLRIVPDQDLQTIVTALETFLQEEWKQLASGNELNINIDHTADWWLGNLDDKWFKALEKAVSDEWGVEPLRIREGGSIPSIPFLEKEFACHALHLPMGQSSDRAHLPNERISLVNLQRGKSVVERFLLNVAATCG